MAPPPGAGMRAAAADFPLRFFTLWLIYLAVQVSSILLAVMSTAVYL